VEGHHGVALVGGTGFSGALTAKLVPFELVGMAQHALVALRLPDLLQLDVDGSDPLQTVELLEGIDGFYRRAR